jgi:hypothetical protein
MAKPLVFSVEKLSVVRGDKCGTHSLVGSGKNAVSTERSSVHARMMA